MDEQEKQDDFLDMLEWIVTTFDVEDQEELCKCLLQMSIEENEHRILV